MFSLKVKLSCVVLYYPHLSICLCLFKCFTTFVSHVHMYGCTRVYPGCMLKVRGCWFSTLSPRVDYRRLADAFPLSCLAFFFFCLFKRLVCVHALAGLEFVTLQSVAGITEPRACKARTTQYIMLPLYRERCTSESPALLSSVQRTKGSRCFQECSKVARN